MIFAQTLSRLSREKTATHFSGSCLAIAGHAAGIGQLESVIDVGAAVIWALIVIGMRRAVIAGERRRSQQDRRMRRQMDLGKSLRWREEEIRLLFDMGGSAVTGGFVIHHLAGIRTVSG